MQFAYEGIEATRQLLLGRELDLDGKGLRNLLVETCTIMGERFPEYDEWLATGQQEYEAHWQQIKELETEISEKKLEIKRLKAEIANHQKALAVQERGNATHPQSRARISSSGRIGRNDPCPCGSGKKFKKCCMNKT